MILGITLLSTYQEGNYLCPIEEFEIAAILTRNMAETKFWSIAPFLQWKNKYKGREIALYILTSDDSPWALFYFIHSGNFIIDKIFQYDIRSNEKCLLTKEIFKILDMISMKEVYHYLGNRVLYNKNSIPLVFDTNILSFNEKGETGKLYIYYKKNKLKKIKIKLGNEFIKIR